MKIPGRETPGSIPNPAVKPSRADGSMWATACESRYRPDVIQEESLFDSPFCFGKTVNRGRRCRLGVGKSGIRRSAPKSMAVAMPASREDKGSVKRAVKRTPG